jgi:uncharacterized membrane protein YidH (DUF202 family)
MAAALSRLLPQYGGYERPVPRYAVTRRVLHWGRSLAIATAVAFVISSVFPVVAGLSRNTSSFPKIWGELDVGLAFVLAVMVFAVMALSRNSVDKRAEESTYRAYRVLLHAIFAMLVVFFVFGDRIVWINSLTGFAWRSWLLLYALPEWIVALRADAPSI